MIFSRLYSAVLVVSAVTVLSGCSFLFGEDGYFRDRGDDYLKAESLPPMQVPEHADKNVFGQLYVVPDVNKAEYEYPRDFEAPRPPALASNLYSEKVKIQRLGENRWIHINTSPSQVWPRVRQFLNENGLAVSEADATLGLIETAWLRFKDDPDHRDKYRIRIEQGVQPESTEIHIVHFQLPDDVELPAQLSWPDTSTNKERESWMVDELAASLASQETGAAASLLAQTIGAADKITIASRDREPVLRMALEPTRAWASLNYAFQQEGFAILEEDADNDIYYVNYTDPDASEGFFSGWFSGGDDGVRYSLDEILRRMNLPATPANRELFPAEVFNGDGEPLQDVPGLLAIMVRRDEAVEIVLRNPKGERLESRQARELLGIVRRNLI